MQKITQRGGDTFTEEYFHDRKCVDFQKLNIMLLSPLARCYDKTNSHEGRDCISFTTQYLKFDWELTYGRHLLNECMNEWVYNWSYPSRYKLINFLIEPEN